MDPKEGHLKKQSRFRISYIVYRNVKKQSQSIGLSPVVLSEIEGSNMNGFEKTKPIEGKMPSALAGGTPATQNKAKL